MELKQGENVRTERSPFQTVVNFSIRMNKQLKADCEYPHGSLGMSLTTAIQVFLKQSLEDGGIPFVVPLPYVEARELQGVA